MNLYSRSNGIDASSTFEMLLRVSVRERHDVVREDSWDPTNAGRWSLVAQSFIKRYRK